MQIFIDYYVTMIILFKFHKYYRKFIPTLSLLLLRQMMWSHETLLIIRQFRSESRDSTIMYLMDMIRCSRTNFFLSFDFRFSRLFILCKDCIKTYLYQRYIKGTKGKKMTKPGKKFVTNVFDRQTTRIGPL